MSNTLAERLRQAAQYTGLDSMRELLIEAAGALEVIEPVAWMVRNGVVCHEIFRSQIDAEVEANAQQRRHDLSGSLAAFNVQPVYTAQQPQERKPLTDEQIRKWWASENGLEDCDMCSLTDFTQVVRAIESAHGIKD